MKFLVEFGKNMKLNVILPLEKFRLYMLYGITEPSNLMGISPLCEATLHLFIPLPTKILMRLLNIQLIVASCMSIVHGETPIQVRTCSTKIICFQGCCVYSHDWLYY